MTNADTTTSRRRVLKSIGAAGAAGLTGLAGCTGDSEESDGINAAWLYVSTIGDEGWSWAHDQGRQAVEEEFDWLSTDYQESVPKADASQVLRDYTSNDYDIIFGTTFEYMNPMEDVASDNPDTLYEHCSGYKTRENMGRYFGRMYQARYLAGIAAGMVTEADSLGYVAAFPIPEVVRGINAFTLGARSDNEDVTTKVRWTNSWYDPTAEGEAAQALVDAGVDVMAQHQDSTAALKTAADADIWASGYDAPMKEEAGDNYLTSPIWHWEVFYEPTLKAVRDDEWESDFYFDGLSDGIIDLDEWGAEVPSEVKDEVSSTRSAIEDGDLDVWSNSKFSDRSETFRFESMGSYVEGVDGEVPSG